MQPAPQTLLDDNGLIDRALCERLAREEVARGVQNHLEHRYELALGSWLEQARMEKVRRAATPEQIRLAALHRELIDGLSTCDYRDLDATRLSIARHQAEREAIRARLAASDMVTPMGEVAAISAEIGRAA